VKLTRRKARRTAANYPTHDDARRNRRDFLKLLARGMLAVPIAGLAGCGVGREQQWELGGVARPPDSLTMDDVEDAREQDLAREEMWTTGGVAPADMMPHPPTPGDAVGEEDWAMAGGPMPPDTFSKPDTCPVGKDVEEDFPPMPGEAPFEPDITGEEDLAEDVEDEEFPQVLGDMPAPE